MEPTWHAIDFGHDVTVPVRTVGTGPGPVVLVVPAMGVRATADDGVARALAEAGCLAVTMALRGHGDSTVRPSRKVDFGYQEIISQDLQAVVAWCKQRSPGRDTVLLGHSLGGQFGALYAGAHPDDLDGLVLVSACSVYVRGWNAPFNVGVLVGILVARLVAGVYGSFPGKTLRFAGVESRGVMRDWAANGLTGRYRVAGGELDYEEALKQVRLPVLCVSFEGDLLAPRQACRNLVAKMENAPISEHRPNRQQLGEHRGHFGWLRCPGLVTRPVVDWLGRVSIGIQPRVISTSDSG